MQPGDVIEDYVIERQLGAGSFASVWLVRHQVLGSDHALKLLGCGWSAEVAPIRILMMADTLAREVDELLGTLDRTFKALA